MANWYPHVDVGTPTHSPTHRHTQKANGIGAGWGWEAGRKYSKNISFSRMVTVFEFITGHVAQCLGSAKGPRFNTAQEGKKNPHIKQSCREKLLSQNLTNFLII